MKHYKVKQQKMSTHFKLLLKKSFWYLEVQELSKYKISSTSSISIGYFTCDKIQKNILKQTKTLFALYHV